MSNKKIFVNGNWWDSIHISVPKDYMEHFDFIDLGAKQGKMRKFAQQNFNGKNGLHVEIEEKYIKDMESNNIPCIQADITNLSFPSKCVDFIISTHTIEHLPNIEQVKGVVEMSINTAKDFVYFTWPSFDSKKYLESLGVTQFFSKMSGHTCHLTISDMNKILKELNVENSVCTSWNKIFNSHYSSIVPLSAPIDCEIENKEKYGEIPKIEFTEPVFYENICLIQLNNSINSQNAFRYIKSFTNV